MEIEGIQFHPEAAQELLSAIEWYENQTGGLGGQFFANVTTCIRELCTPEMTGSSYSELIRYLRVKRFPYIVIYYLGDRENLKVVIAIAHTHRRPNYWMNRIVDEPR